MRTLEADWYRQEDSSLVYNSNLYVTNIFDRVDGTANICQQFEVKRTNNDFGQQRHAAGLLTVVPEKNGALAIFRK